MHQQRLYNAALVFHLNNNRKECQQLRLFLLKAQPRHTTGLFDIENNHILDQITKYNNINSDLQIENIVKKIDIIKNKSDPNLYNKIIKNQTQKALEWCKFYDLDINHKSDFLK